ncbi:MAG: hypothetical protein L0Y54_10655 [Sporichthyaceae bacterium]|nr:hypothetical protein [Sporichthyaceae bacterium]
MTSRIDYHNRRFQPVDHDPQAGGSIPLGHYHQDGDLVWAEFSGGSVRVGRLVGQVRPDDTIDASYCFVTAAGQIVAGACVSTPTRLADGRVRLTEDWKRIDGSSGISIIEEVAG